ncbi:MAG TPA: nitronate monooxygenase [Solirubrobacteraceae bacterium]|nr:nitronate monooxygenase [Solirubrobacteraceae bacterium]
MPGDDPPPPPTSPVLAGLRVPIVLAPMAGGPSTPALAAAVAGAGGLGMLAAGYLSPDRLAADIARLRGLDDRPFAVNLFVGGEGHADPEAVDAYARQLTARAIASGVALGEPRFDDDAFAAKLARLESERPAVVSFTFGLPAAAAVQAVHAWGGEAWMTVTSVAEARAAQDRGADVLVVQGVEAGGHRGVFHDQPGQSELGLLAALQLIGAESPLPLVAAGAIMTGPALAAVLVAGAAAAQLGTAYLLSDEAGTSAAQRAATATDTPTVLTRAFSGRTARGIVNRWHAELGDQAPAAYPEVHHLTAPLRAHGRASGDPDLINLWAGEAHALARTGPAGQITRDLWREAQGALSRQVKMI